MLDQFLKTGGSDKFYPNRSIVSTQSCVSKVGNLADSARVFRYQKVDVPVKLGHRLNTNGGYLIPDGKTFAMAYSSIQANGGPVGTGKAAWAYITIGSGLFSDGDTITFGTRTLTLITSGSSSEDVLLIDDTDPHTQLDQIKTYFLTSGLVPYTSFQCDFHGIIPNTLVLNGNALNSSLDTTVISVTSTNPAISVNSNAGVFHPWKACDLLKDVFIVSPRLLYSYRPDDNVQGGTTDPYFNSLEYDLEADQVIRNVYFGLQLISNKTKNSGFYLRKNTVKNASVRLPYTNEVYNYVEFISKIPGTAGNSLTISFVTQPAVQYQPRASYFTASGNNITFHLASSYYGQVVYSYSVEALYQAYERSEPEVQALFSVSGAGSLPALEVASLVPFSGGENSAGSDYCRNAFIDYYVSGILDSESGVGAAIAPPEMAEDGTSRIIHDAPGSAWGKYGCFVARYLPENTPIHAYAQIHDLWFTAVTGGVAGNSITIEYTSGGTAGSESVSVLGNAITVQIEDGISTSETIFDALTTGPSAAAVSALVKIKKMGLSNDAPVAAMASPVSLVKGSAGYTTPSGYVIVPRLNASVVTYTRYFDVYWSSDLNTPSSFKYCQGFSISFPYWNPHYNVTSFRESFEIKDGYDLIGPYVSFIYRNNQQEFRIRPDTKASLNYNSTHWEAVTPGFAGSDLKIQILGTKTVGNELVTMVGNLIKVEIQNGLSTVQSVQTALSNNPAAAALVSVSPASGYTTASPVTVGSDEYLVGGKDAWFVDGMYGFGYVSLTPRTYAINDDQNTMVQIPYANKDYMVMDTFRLVDLE
jgi:hypothetical protein